MPRQVMWIAAREGETISTYYDSEWDVVIEKDRVTFFPKEGYGLAEGAEYNSWHVLRLEGDNIQGTLMGTAPDRSPDFIEEDERLERDIQQEYQKLGLNEIEKTDPQLEAMVRLFLLSSGLDKENVAQEIKNRLEFLRGGNTTH